MPALLSLSATPWLTSWPRTQWTTTARPFGSSADQVSTPSGGRRRAPMTIASSALNAPAGRTSMTVGAAAVPSRAYSSWGETTVPSMRNLLVAPRAVLGLFLGLRHGVKRRDPGSRRAPPLLPSGTQLIALTKNADANHVGGLYALADRRRIDWRAAFAAKRLYARRAALRRSLEIHRRLAGDLESGAGNGDRNAKRGASADLAIGTVADLRPLWVSLGFDSDRATGARAVNFHEI